MFGSILKKLSLRSVSRYTEPFLGDDIKKQRIEWAMRWIRSSADAKSKFHSFDDIVHLDEKWFHLC